MTNSANDSHVHLTDSATSYVGYDATRLFAVASLRASIKLYIKTGMKASRAHTPTAMLAAATRVTGKRYKRGQLAKAAEDLDLWIAAMHAALPVIDDRTEV
jgi:hypothetical protein